MDDTGVGSTSQQRREVLRIGAGALVAAVAMPAWVRHARAAERPRFSLGVASGSPTADSVVLWTRLTGEDLAPGVPVRWELAADEAFTRIVARGSEAAPAAEAHTLHVQIRGLEPARGYFYRFSALGQASPIGRTRTAPASDAAVSRFDFAIASCQRWEHGHWAAWRDVAEGAPELVVFLGDYIYEYAATPIGVRTHAQGAASTLESYRERYALYKSDPLLQAAHAACPWVAIWDDHEVDNDYAGLQGQGLVPEFPARRAAAYQAWWEHMPLPRALKPRPEGGGIASIHGRLDWGRLARLQWMDGRQFRDPQPCPRGRGGSSTVRPAECPSLGDESRSLLGAAQERWLAEGFSLERPWNLLAQTTLMARFSTEAVQPATEGVPATGRYWTDGWDGYPAARRRLLSTLAERRVPGAVVLSGDVHAHYVAHLRVDPDARVDGASPIVATEFCTSSISSRSWPQSAVDAVLPHNPHVVHGRSDQRGAVRFSLTRDRLEADLRGVADVRDAASAVVSQAKFVVAAAQAGAERG
jgi:alkaline phosphatase D